MASLKHLGIIMDGNRRWATNRGLPSFMGHQQGYETLKKIVPAVFDRGISVLTLFAFSTENWNRTKEEVDHLLILFDRAIREQFEKLTEEGIQVRFIGDISAFPESLKSAMLHCSTASISHSEHILTIAVNYGGRYEILNAIKNIIRKGVSPEDITEELISRSLYTGDLPDPDLIIRTSGEQRTSGFLTWQAAYSELYFTQKLWPEFSIDDLDAALAEYEERQRRFGA